MKAAAERRRERLLQTLLKRREWLPWAVGGLTAVLLVYANSLDNAFHFDDFHTITDNPAVRSLANVPAFFRDASLFSVLPPNRTYRPVVSASLAIDYALGRGYHPFWFHISTMVWFVVLLGALAALYRKAMTAMRPDAARANARWAIAGATWFGLHPAMAETVNYVIQRGDLYCTLGCVAALVVWSGRPLQRKFGLYLLPLVLALFSKPPAAVFPALLLFWVYFFETEGEAKVRWRQAAVASVPATVLVACLLLLQVHMTPPSFRPSELSATAYRMTQPFVWLRYLGQFFLPTHLNIDTDLPAYSSINTAVIAGFAFVAALLFAIVYTARRRTLYPVAFGLIWFVLTQLPTSLYPLSEVENDHRMFFSFAGLILACLWSLRLGAERLLTHWRKPWLVQALTACGLLALAGYAWGTHARNAVWHTEDSLWKDDVQKSPHNGRGLMIYGLTLMNHGQYTAADAEFERALQYTPNYATLEINLGVVNGAMGLQNEAERHFERAIALQPQDDQPHTFYGRWLLSQGRIAEAREQLRQAVELNPARTMPRDLLAQALQQPLKVEPAVGTGAPVTEADWINRSLLLNRAGRFQESIAAARQALTINPNSAVAWNNIAAGFEGERKWAPAIAAARKALALQPDFLLAKNNLAWSVQQKALGSRSR